MMPETKSMSGRARGPHSGVDVRPGAIREARLNAGLSLAELAAGAVTRAAIHSAEVGRNRPSRRTLDHIVARTGKPLAFFVPVGSVLMEESDPGANPPEIQTQIGEPDGLLGRMHAVLREREELRLEVARLRALLCQIDEAVRTA